MDWYDVVDGLKLLLVCLFGVAMVFGLIFGLMAAFTLMEKPMCEAYALSGDGHNYQYTFWTGCKMLSPKGYWINPSDAYLLEVPDGVIVPVE